MRWNNFDTVQNKALGQVKIFDHFAHPDPIPGNGWVKYTYDIA